MNTTQCCVNLIRKCLVTAKQKVPNCYHLIIDDVILCQFLRKYKGGFLICPLTDFNATLWVQSLLCIKKESDIKNLNLAIIV